MRILQIGAGSMGSRRLRDLHDRTDLALTVFDQRADRRAAATARFGVPAVDSIEAGLADEPDVLVISTPPDRHEQYVRLALDTGRHFFCEADIWPYDHRTVTAATEATGRVAAPSCTLRFHPFIRELRRIVTEELGTLHAYGYLLSVDAPSWHPGEGAEYYARHPATAPAREMVPFELIALDYIFGTPAAVTGRLSRRGNLDLPGPDCWSLQLELDNGATGQLTVLMACPRPARSGWAVGERGIMRFDLLTGTVWRDDEPPRSMGDWVTEYEPMYRAEMDGFLASVRGEAAWPYSYHAANLVCATLAAAERGASTGRMEHVTPDLRPAPLP